MAKKYKITVMGSGQCNGPVRILKSVIFDDLNMASKFRGGKRYEVMTDFVKTHYPGVSFKPRDLTATLEVIED